MNAILDIWTDGDRSVGVDGASLTVTFDGDWFSNEPEFRKQVENELREIVGNWLDEKAHTMFRENQ